MRVLIPGIFLKIFNNIHSMTKDSSITSLKTSTSKPPLMKSESSPY
jgi:hypothetical protein